ncbi:penicillin-binding protein [Streptomyces adustus]|uniref:Penicillin-binding protein n=1 Tax=Streptomyces adustus TaxID=1609272 RepID=A0A5N8VCI3_9ACTN|nr:penicillin-binding transpeptidase domain-containing protein [Streptomyces adustus]MPY32957.1 penicillin-binding protein [Streptomyces adustus]
MNRAAKTVVTGAVTALLVAGGVGAYNLLHELTTVGDDGTEPAFDPAAVSRTPPSGDKAEELAETFLGNWSLQHLDSAAADTDEPTSAVQALKDYADGLHLKKLSFSHIRSSGPSAVTKGATKVAFDVTAEVDGGTWSYASAVAVRQSSNGATAVRWNNSVLYPGLQNDQSLTAGQLPPGASDATVVASDGRTDLSAYPSLRDIVASIRKHAPAKGGTPGIGVAVVDGDGIGVEAAEVFRKGRTPAIKTTIDAHLQEAAEHAVMDAHLQHKPAGTVALDWRTGHILALAHTGDHGDIAINGIKSPGSTMKIITSAALFDQAGLTADSPAPCADSLVANSQTFHNDEGVKAAPNATIAQAFTVSCNTSFIKDGFHYLVHDGDASALNEEATDVFGMGSWTIGGGVATTDPSIPADVQGSDQAAQFIGQGKVTATPLFMASVAATVRNTGFEQPIILPGQPQTSAPKRMSARTAGYLETMMRSVATSGTAAPRLRDLPGVGAKTGTAEEGDHTNGWLTAYNSHIAVAALVEGGTSGVDSAGYVVRQLLTAR